jgi:hypothetical protein
MFTANPLPQESGEQTLRFMETIETLTKDITSADAERFKSWSDKYKDKKVSLGHCLDDDAKFLIDFELKRNKIRLDLSEDELLTWYTRWTHNRLSKMVTKIWSGQEHKTHITLDTAYDDFKIDLNSHNLDIINVSGEQKMLIALNALAEKYGNAESLQTDNKARYFKVLKAKIPKKN